MPNARTRLCIVVPSHWAAQLGGAEMQVRTLVQKLVSLDTFDIHYIARQIDPAHLAKGYTLHGLTRRKAVAGTFLYDAPQVLALLARLQPDAIYQRVACAYTGVAAYYARRNRRRLIWHVSSDRDLMPHRWHPTWQSPVKRLNKAFIDYGARHADRIVVQNLQQAALLEARYRRTDALHIPNFHSLPPAPPTKDPERITVCWIGSIKPLKQAELFARLADDLQRHRHVRFVMVGAPQMPAQAWQTLLARIQGKPNLHYTGQQPLDAVEKLLESAHLLVNTSTVEGFPNTFIQSWLREVPVISLSVNPDGAFDDDRYGMCANGSYERLRECVDRLIVDAGLRRQIGVRAREFARMRFSESNLERIIDLLQPAR